QTVTLRAKAPARVLARTTNERIGGRVAPLLGSAKTRASSVARREEGLAGLGVATARGNLGAAANQASALRERAEILAVAQRIQRHRYKRAKREALYGDALLRDRGGRAELDAPGDRFAVGADDGFAVVTDDLEQELRVIGAGDEADESSRVRDLLGLVVHRERMMCMRRGRGEHGGCRAESGQV